MEKKQRRTRAQILTDKLERLEAQREKNVNRYIIGIEMKITETRDKLKQYYRDKHGI